MAWTDGMSGGEHIFEWARNTQSLYRRMLRVRVPGNFVTVGRQAAEALDVARSSLADMRRANESPSGTYDARDVLQAALLFLEWNGED